MKRRHFPHGKKYHDDEGELEIRIAADHENGVVRIDFPKPIVWIAFEPTEAEGLANLILKKSAELRKKDDEQPTQPQR